MKSKRTTEKALVLSIISTFLCIAMLAGTTFAWFSQNKSQNVSDIKIGGFGVDILNASGAEFDTNDTLTFTPAGNWEPGKTYTMDTFQVKNSGQLELKYVVKANLPTVEGLTWKINGTAATVENELVVSQQGTLAAGATESIVITCEVSEDLTTSYAEPFTGNTVMVYATQNVSGAEL